MKHIKLWVVIYTLSLVFTACEKSTLSAPTGLQGRQSGNSISLAWNRVEGATSYEIQRNGTFLSDVYSTTYTDNNPVNGYNAYEVYAKDGMSRSTSAYINVFFEGSSSGGNGGGSNPGDNTETNLPITKSNITGYWQYTTRTWSDGSTADMSNFYVNFSNDGIWEQVSIESSSKCYVTYGTWSVSGSVISVYVEAQNCFVNGTYSFSYPDANTTNLYGVETLTSNAMSYKEGTYPYMITYDLKRVSNIPASYQHNADIDKSGGGGSGEGSGEEGGGGSSSDDELTINKTNLTGTWKCTYNGEDDYYWVLKSSGAAFLVVDESSYMPTGSYHKFVGTWIVSGSSFTVQKSKYYYYLEGTLDYSEVDYNTETVNIISLTSRRFIDDEGDTWTKTSLPNYINL